MARFEPHCSKDYRLTGLTRQKGSDILSALFVRPDAHYPMQMNQNLQQAVRHSTVTCPTCSTTRLYHLADGRYKCSLCRRVFSAVDNRHARLNVDAREGLSKSFWQMRGTTDTALELCLNIKTVQKYFGLLRENLAKQSQQSVLKQLGAELVPVSWFDRFPQRVSCGQAAQPLAAVIKADTGLHLLQAAPVAAEPRFTEDIIIGWLYSQDEESKSRINLDRIHCQSRDSSCITLTAPFWRFIKQGLIHYQGGFRHNFMQYLREMEFRYNDRQTVCGPEICLQHLAVE